jgi:hypothetical protein
VRDLALTGGELVEYGASICRASSPPPRQVSSLFVNTAGSAQDFHRVGLVGVVLTKLPPALLCGDM